MRLAVATYGSPYAKLHQRRDRAEPVTEGSPTWSAAAQAFRDIVRADHPDGTIHIQDVHREGETTAMVGGWVDDGQSATGYFVVLHADGVRWTVHRRYVMSTFGGSIPP